MKQYEKTTKALIKHYQTYPQLQMQDIFKFIHQSAFGCEHLVSSIEAATAYISEEYTKGNFPENAPLIEPLDGAYSRVYLSYLNHGLHAETLAHLFYKSACTETDGVENAKAKLQIAKELSACGKLPFSANDFETAAKKWIEDGCPAQHHSDTFRSVYRPAYRVISNRFTPFLPLFARLDSCLQNGRTVLAIEGGSASGKSTLATLLEQIYDCTVFHMDDFFLRPEQRTQERLATAGGNIDHERFAEEIITALADNKPVQYRKFDCSTTSLSEMQSVTPKKLVVVEGAYSLHPKFGKYFDCSVFLNIDSNLQRMRINKRNTPPLAERFFNEWIPMEQLYFSKFQIQERCDLTIDILQ